MNFNNSLIANKLVPANYLKLATDAQKSKETLISELLTKCSLPVDGWSDELIEELVRQLAALDSNNFSKKSGLGEREARIACKLVARRHYNFGHGIGRSGDLLEPQPKAAGSTLLNNLVNALLLQLIREMGVRSCKFCFLVPMATGMTLNLCLLALKKQRPEAKYVIWSRIDQKSCFKSITSAGLIPIVIDQTLGQHSKESELHTDVKAIKSLFLDFTASEILCIFTTTSCFAPRCCDDIITLAKLAAEHIVPHLVNNAYGLQSTYITHQLEQAQRAGGRVDLFVQSTDKNLMVPVGGAIVAGFDEQLVRSVAKTYAGRASSSQSLDVLMTLLSLGKNGYKQYVNERKSNYEYLKQKLKEFAEEHNEMVIAKDNSISLALTLNTLQRHSSVQQLSQFGSMLYTRGVSGVRVITNSDNREIDGYKFQNWGTHTSNYECPYLTVAASIGLLRSEIDTFFTKLQNCWKEFMGRQCDIKT